MQPKPSITLITLCFIAIQALVISTSYARGDGGSMDGGGGSIISLNGCPMLLDIYLEQAQSEQTSQDLRPCQTGATLKNSAALKSIGIDRLNNSSAEIVNKARLRLKPWMASSPFVTMLMDSVLDKAPIFYTRYQIAFKTKNYFIPNEYDESITDEDLKTVAYYTKDFGILISKSDFESLNEDNQIALLLHESLRHIQIQYGQSISNASIQKISAAITLRSPKDGESLDTQEYLDGDLLTILTKPNETKNKIQNLRQRACSIGLKHKENITLTADIAELEQICDFNTNYSARDLSRITLELEKKMDDVHAIELDKSYELINISSEFTTISVGDVVFSIKLQNSTNSLVDSVLDLKHSKGLDVAIADAKHRIGWVTGSKWKIKKAMSNLVKAGFLK